MKTIRSLLAVAALAVALTSCSGTDQAVPPAGGDGGAPAVARTGVAAEVESAFLAYNTALGNKDYATACSLSSPETGQKLVDALSSKGVPVGSCEEAFGALLADPAAAEGAAEVSRTLTIDDVTVAGETATVTWTAQSQGQPQSRSTEMRRTDKGWVLGTTS